MAAYPIEDHVFGLTEDEIAVGFVVVVVVDDVDVEEGYVGMVSWFYEGYGASEDEKRWENRFKLNLYCLKRRRLKINFRHN